MKSYVFYIQKGGVGKTSLSVSIAYELSKIEKTIIVDVDPQGNSSSWMLTESPKYELADYLYKRVDIKDVIVNLKDKFSIIPTFGINGNLRGFGETEIQNRPFVFCKMLDDLQTLDYKYVIFDLSPTFNQLCRAVVVASQYIITPLRPETFGLDGLEIFFNDTKELKSEWRQAATHTHIIINGYNKTILQHRIIESETKKLTNFKVFTVPVDTIFSKAQAENKTVDMLNVKPKIETQEAIKSIVESML